MEGPLLNMQPGPYLPYISLHLPYISPRWRVPCSTCSPAALRPTTTCRAWSRRPSARPNPNTLTLPLPLTLTLPGGPGPDGQWAAAAQDAVGPPLHRSSPSASPTPLVGAEDIIELDDIFDVLDNWDDFEKQPELKDLEAEIKGEIQAEIEGAEASGGGPGGGPGGGEADDAARTAGAHAAGSSHADAGAGAGASLSAGAPHGPDG